MVGQLSGNYMAVITRHTFFRQFLRSNNFLRQSYGSLLISYQEVIKVCKIFHSLCTVQSLELKGFSVFISKSLLDLLVFFNLIINFFVINKFSIEE